MTGTPDDTLKRVFARAPQVGADEAFVGSLAAEVAVRRGARRARRAVLVVFLVVIAIGLAFLLAPFAPVTSLADLGNSLLALPNELGGAAQSAGHLPGALYIGLALAFIVVPLAGALWLARRE